MARSLLLSLTPLLAGLLLAGCQHTNRNGKFREFPAFQVFPDPQGRAYFPEGKPLYYTRYLAAMGEPSLMAELPEGTTFSLRFTLLQPLSADDLAVRVYDEDGVVKARAVRSRNDANFKPAGITDDRTLTLGRRLPGDIRRAVSRADFWRPTYGPGMDGGEWIFEYRDRTGHRMVHLWRPDLTSKRTASARPEDGPPPRDFEPYVKLGTRLLELANLQPDPGPE